MHSNDQHIAFVSVTKSREREEEGKTGRKARGEGWSKNMVEKRGSGGRAGGVKPYGMYGSEQSGA